MGFKGWWVGGLGWVGYGNGIARDIGLFILSIFLLLARKLFDNLILLRVCLVGWEELSCYDGQMDEIYTSSFIFMRLFTTAAVLTVSLI